MTKKHLKMGEKKSQTNVKAEWDKLSSSCSPSLMKRSPQRCGNHRHLKSITRERWDVATITPTLIAACGHYSCNLWPLKCLLEATDVKPFGSKINFQLQPFSTIISFNLRSAFAILPYQVFFEVQGHRQVNADSNSSQNKVTVNKISPLSFTLPLSLDLIYSIRHMLLSRLNSLAAYSFSLHFSWPSSPPHTHTHPHQNIELRRRHASQTTLKGRRAHTNTHRHTSSDDQSSVKGDRRREREVDSSPHRLCFGWRSVKY